MADSRRIAGLVGPVLVAIILTENPFVNPRLYDAQIPPLVYLSGTLLVVAGLSIVRAHNRWSVGWPVLVTVVGWVACALGLVRMTFPHAYLQTETDSGPVVLVVEAALLALGLFLTWKGYFGERERGAEEEP